MVLQKEDSSDKKFDRKATLIVDGKKYRMNVYGDKEHPDRRTVIGPDFPGEELPSRARVRWMGDTYDAQLTFRYRKGGGRVPGYQWFVDN